MSKKTDRDKQRINVDDVYAGLKVQKLSGKPFKYGGKTGTVMEVVKSTHTSEPAVRIAEDNSVINIYQLVPGI